jgi:thymidylate kinase
MLDKIGGIRMSIVILEGVNRTGKSTLAALLSTYGYSVMKDNSVHNVCASERMVYSKGGILATTQVLEAISNQNVKLVIDRFHLTELVYGEIERGYFAGYVWGIDDRLAKAGVKLVYMDDDIKAINERAGKDLERLKFIFDFAFQDSKMEKFKYNLKEPVKKVINWLGV